MIHDDILLDRVIVTCCSFLATERLDGIWTLGPGQEINELSLIVSHCHVRAHVILSDLSIEALVRVKDDSALRFVKHWGVLEGDHFAALISATLDLDQTSSLAIVFNHDLVVWKEGSVPVRGVCDMKAGFTARWSILSRQIIEVVENDFYGAVSDKVWALNLALQCYDIMTWLRWPRICWLVMVFNYQSVTLVFKFFNSNVPGYLLGQKCASKAVITTNRVEIDAILTVGEDLRALR